MKQSTKIKVEYSELYNKYKSIIRFIIVGCTNTGVDFFIFVVLNIFFSIDKFICQLAGYGLGTLNSFVMNKFWTFENKSTKFETIHQFIKFIVVNFISLGISLICLKTFTENYGMNIYISKFIVIFVVQISNFIGYNLWIFR